MDVADATEPRVRPWMTTFHRVVSVICSEDNQHNATEIFSNFRSQCRSNGVSWRALFCQLRSIMQVCMHDAPRCHEATRPFVRTGLLEPKTVHRAPHGEGGVVSSGHTLHSAPSEFAAICTGPETSRLRRCALREFDMKGLTDLSTICAACIFAHSMTHVILRRFSSAPRAQGNLDEHEQC